MCHSCGNDLGYRNNFVIAIPNGPRLKIICCLGQGSYGTVYKAKDVQTGEIFALKCTPLYPRDQENLKIFQEGELHDIVNELVGVVELIATWHFRHHFILALRCYKRTLQTFLKSVHIPTAATVYKFTRTLAATLSDCHEILGVAHCDLKEENILLDQDRNPLIGDWGLATQEEVLYRYRGTEHMVSPECFQTRENVGCFNAAASDVWSLGIILFAMLTDVDLWDKPDASDPLYARFTRDEEGFLRGFKIPDFYINLLLDIFTHQDARPTMSEIVVRLDKHWAGNLHSS